MNVGYLEVRRLVYRGTIESKTEYAIRKDKSDSRVRNLRKWNNNKKKIKTEKTSRK